MIDEVYRGARIFANPVNYGGHDRVRWNRTEFDWRTAKFGVDYGFSATVEGAKSQIDALEAHLIESAP